MPLSRKNAQEALYLYRELTSAQRRALQRRLKAGELRRIAPGVLTSLPEDQWPALIARERNRVLAELFSGAVIGFRSAFAGGVPVEGVMHLSYRYDRTAALPGLTVVLIKAKGPVEGDQPIAGRQLYFPSNARLLLENLTISRGVIRKAVGESAVEERLVSTCEARGQEALNQLRDHARALAPILGLAREFAILERLIGGILGTNAKARLATAAGKAHAAGLPYDSGRLQLIDTLAARLRSEPLVQPATPVGSAQAHVNFAFLESYFSNFIEGTEFDVQEARDIVLEGKPLPSRPKDSHDILGVFRQATEPAWRNLTLASGEPALEQLKARHADLMRARPEVAPGEFKDRPNFAGSTAFVEPRLVRGTLVQASQMLPSVPAGTGRALLAMFIVAEVHPFADGNGRTARLVMNAELSAVNACRIIVPTLFREEYLDCLRALSRNGDPEPFVAAMQRILHWTASFDYEDLSRVIALMQSCHAFEKSRAQFKLLFPSELAQAAGRTPRRAPKAESSE